VAWEALRRCSLRSGFVLPYYLTERDYVWLAELIEEFEAFVGERRGLLEARLRAAGDASQSSAHALAVRVLRSEYGAVAQASVPPHEARRTVFCQAAQRTGRATALRAASAELGVPPAAVEAALFADFPLERRLTAPPARLDAAALALRCNALIQQSLLARSTDVAITLEGNARAVVRHALLRGLICTVSGLPGHGPVSMAVSGPLSLFRRTTLYGRALAQLVPVLAWCRHFQLAARCVLRQGTGTFVLRSGDPVRAAAEPRRYDSQLEQRFAREFARQTEHWDLVREPAPVAALGTLIFPDFALQQRRDATRRWLLEIAGFWTTDYIAHKLDRLRAAGLDRLILCLDASRDCGRAAVPEHARVVWFRQRVDPSDVLAIIEANPA
jgi:predicted nuclease of restriction endonuclease-like RecB superfamily